MANNLDAAMALVADDTVRFCYQDPCLTKKEQVRTFWQTDLAHGWIPYVSVLSVDGKTVKYAFTAVHNGRIDGWGTGQVVVEDGKVTSDT
jgi:hypothetical protein